MRFFLIIALFFLSCHAANPTGKLGYQRLALVAGGQMDNVSSYFKLENVSLVSSLIMNQHVVVKQSDKPSPDSVNPSQENEIATNEAIEDNYIQVAFKVAAVIVLLLFFAIIGFFILRYFRKHARP